VVRVDPASLRGLQPIKLRFETGRVETVDARAVAIDRLTRRTRPANPDPIGRREGIDAGAPRFAGISKHTGPNA
jgi:hypothetical protein